jgi:HEAT repeat protein
VLIPTLRVVDVDVRREIIAALGANGPPATAAIPELRRLIRDDAESRQHAEAALRSMRAGDKTRPYLRRALSDEKPHVEQVRLRK